MKYVTYNYATRTTNRKRALGYAMRDVERRYGRALSSHEARIDEAASNFVRGPIVITVEATIREETS